LDLLLFLIGACHVPCVATMCSTATAPATATANVASWHRGIVCDQVHVLDLSSGAPLGKRPITHTIEIAEVVLDQGNGGRTIALVDKNRDLFVTILHRSKYKLAKLGTMVQSLVWHDEYVSSPCLCVCVCVCVFEGEGRRFVLFGRSLNYVGCGSQSRVVCSNSRAHRLRSCAWPCF
jgi:hypothetical protein